ncbi:hypothetical protein ACH3VR_03885 [Microbacterium sp. B2969]|uniref:Uncharacterized protein n=1 Tax=Microbacterium alkaliflavum TaxID=3248839 RepID=A0ABW7Q3U4_9MICO
MTVLVDPHLIVRREGISSLPEDEFWRRVVEVAARDDFAVGHETFHWIIQRLMVLGYPDQNVEIGESSFRRESRVALDRLLARVSRGSSPPDDAALRPEYLGDSDAELSLIMDATEHAPELDAVMSCTSQWNPAEAHLVFGNLRVEALYDADREPASSAREHVASVFSDRRIHILGGAPTPSALRDIETELGVRPDRVLWIASEKSKPPRNLDERWGSLNPTVDIALCVTGRVAHSSWEAGESAARSCGVEMLECASQGRIVATLHEWARRQSRA